MLPAPHPFRHGGPFSLILSYLWPEPSDTRMLVIAPHPAALSAVGALPFSVLLCRLHHLSLPTHHHTPFSLLRPSFNFNRSPSPQKILCSTELFPPTPRCLLHHSKLQLAPLFYRFLPLPPHQASRAASVTSGCYPYLWPLDPYLIAPWMIC